MFVSDNLRGLVLFVILLVISIVPASAVQITQVQDISSDINDIKKDQARMDPILNSMQSNADYINARTDFAKDNWWKFWKWKEIWNIFTVEIPGKTQQLKDSADQIKPYAENIGKNAENIRVTARTTDNNTISNVTTPINYIIEKLNIMLNQTLVANNIADTNDLKEGDIIQYYSQDKYDRYLSIHKIDANDDFVVLKVQMIH